MQFETREVINLDLVGVLGNFGWKVTGKSEESYNRQSALYGTKVVFHLSRSKSIPNYTKISELENEYFRCNDSIKRITKIHKPTLIFLLILGIIPGLIYYFYHNHQNKLILINNKKAEDRMMKIIEEVNLL